MPFLLPNQQRQSTEGKKIKQMKKRLGIWRSGMMQQKCMT